MHASALRSDRLGPVVPPVRAEFASADPGHGLYRESLVCGGLAAQAPVVHRLLALADRRSHRRDATDLVDGLLNRARFGGSALAHATVYAACPGSVNVACLAETGSEEHDAYAAAMAKKSSKKELTPEQIAERKKEQEALGQRFRTLRVSRKPESLSQDEAVLQLGVTKAALSAWETGRNMPNPFMLRKMAKLYGVSVDALLWDNSLSPEAMKFAAQYDNLSGKMRGAFEAMWLAYFERATSDEEMDENIKIKVPTEVEAQPEQHDEEEGDMVGGSSQMGGLDEGKQPTPKKGRH